MCLIDAKRVGAHQTIDAHVADPPEAKVMHRQIEHLLPHSNSRQFAHIRAEFVKSRMGIRRLWIWAWLSIPAGGK